MANLKEKDVWEDGIYQIEENDPVLGGENGITNKPIKQLANRTLWLKKALELFGKKSAPKDLTANSTSTADESGHSHKLPVGSTTQKGIWQATSDTGVDSDGLVLTAKAGKKLAQMIAVVQLALGNYIPLNKRSSAVNSNSNDTVATSAAVKSANDNANTRVAKSGDTMTGDLSFKQGDYSGINLYNNNGYYLRLEGNNHDNGTMITAVYRKPNGENVAVAFLPKRDGTIAYIDQVVNKTGDTMTGNLTVPNLIVNDPANNNNFVQIGDDTKLIDVDMGHTVGLQTTDNANDAYIAYGATKKRFGFDGTNFSAESGLGAKWFGSQKRGEGAYVSQWQTEAPYHVYAGNANGSNTYFPYLKGKVTNGDGWGSAFSFGYTTPDARNRFGVGVIHLIEDNGSEKHWFFEHDGKLRGDDFECQGKRLSKSHQTDYAYVETTAAIWGGLKINRNGDHMLIESNDRGGFSFVRRNKDGSNVYVLSAPAKNGTLATLEDFGGNLSGNGWTRLPNGLILQWGTANGGWVNFPIAFPNACFSVVGTQGQGGDYEPYVIYNISNTRFYHKGRVEHEANGAHWMAIGN
jgi:probable tail fiber protein|nr:MAG TPA: tail fiber repeat protein [Caudoviricetes sp.]